MNYQNFNLADFFGILSDELHTIFDDFDCEKDEEKCEKKSEKLFEKKDDNKEESYFHKLIKEWEKGKLVYDKEEEWKNGKKIYNRETKYDNDGKILNETSSASCEIPEKICKNDVCDKYKDVKNTVDDEKKDECKCKSDYEMLCDKYEHALDKCEELENELNAVKEELKQTKEERRSAESANEILRDELDRLIKDLNTYTNAWKKAAETFKSFSEADLDE